MQGSFTSLGEGMKKLLILSEQIINTIDYLAPLFAVSFFRCNIGKRSHRFGSMLVSVSLILHQAVVVVADVIRCTDIQSKLNFETSRC